MQNPQLYQTPTLNTNNCRFGMWFNGVGESRYGHFNEFQQLGISHRKLHELGHIIIELAGSDTADPDQIARQIAELHTLKNQLSRELYALLELLTSEQS